MNLNDQDNATRGDQMGEKAPVRGGGLSRHTAIFIGLIGGAAAGVATNLVAGGSETAGKIVTYVTEPIGRMWLNGLIMTVVPLVVSTLATGVAGLGSLRRVGRVGVLTLVSFIVLTLLSTLLGLLVMNVVQPGLGLDPLVKTQLMEAYRGAANEAMGLSQGAFGIHLLVKIVPRNPIQAAASGDMLAIIFASLVLGVALTKLPEDKARPLKKLLDSIGHVVVAIIDLVMKLAPIGVFCLIYSVTARFGFGLLVNLLQFVLVVVLSLLVFQFAGYGAILTLVCGRRPREFFSKIRPVMITAFSTSSSNATLPTTMRIAEEKLGLPREISSFVLPLGATMNMNGTALFEGATVLFLAQVFGVHLSPGAQVIVVVMSVVSAIGTAGVPGGSIPLLMMVLGMVGVPMEAIAIILGVDRLLDMCRTVLNVTGDLVTATFVDRVERRGSRQPEPLPEPESS